MDDTGRKLLELKRTYERAREQRNRVQGQLEEALESLRKHGAKDVEDARKLLENLDEKIQKLESQLKKLVKEIENEFEQTL